MNAKPTTAGRPFSPIRVMLGGLTWICGLTATTLGQGVLQSVTYPSIVAPGQPLEIQIAMYNSGVQSWQAWLHRVDSESWDPSPYTVTVTHRQPLAPGSSRTAVLTRADLPTTPGTCSLRLRAYYYIGGDYAYEMDNSPRWISFTVAPPSSLSVTQHPTNQTVWASCAASFCAEASGSPPPTLQWQVATNGAPDFTDLPGATNTTLAFITQSAQNGNRYRARFDNASGTQWSSAALLSVLDPPTILSHAEGFGFTSNRFGFIVSGPPDRTAVVEGSQNLLDWHPLSTNVLGNAPLHVTDPDLPILPHRFYRLRAE